MVLLRRLIFALQKVEFVYLIGPVWGCFYALFKQSEAGTGERYQTRLNKIEQSTAQKLTTIQAESLKSEFPA